MNVIAYKLKPILNYPHLKFHYCDDLESTVQLIYLLCPDYVIIAAEEAEELLHQIDVDRTEETVFTIVDESITAQKTRKWTALGVSEVWSLLDWEEQLSQRTTKAVLEGSESISTVSMDEKNTQDHITIAVGGVYGGVGCTHTSILLANYLASTQKTKVAVWEGGTRPCFSFWEYYRKGENSRAPLFEHGDISFYKKENTPANWINALSQDYKFLILDLGNLDSENTSFFLNAKIPILLGSGSEWRARELIHFCQKHQSARQDYWRVVLPMASDEGFADMTECLKGRPVFSVPVHPNVFQRQDDTDQQLEGILSPILQKKNRKGLSRLFR
ncbi:hypothetical protein [Paenibacillus woosongensis]|uniref:Uncharacterized protein n=1 Tax=Paenibacillus woosongensis TaxID=307580 RepID=A0ABQ4MZ40_9BACL|nr:hypothetical protein [Paenibacillus woosongensis]GIP61145.1 hypothetical protein J15TS10_49590 [Paenibacillus woosongensis]